MTRRTAPLAVLAVAVACSVGHAAAQPAQEEVVVTSTRLYATLGKPLVKHSEGRPIPGSSYEASMQGRVSAAGLDLAKPDDVAKFEQRIFDTAYDVCDRLGQLYPNSRPDVVACAKAAKEGAMPQVQKLVAAAKARPARP